MKRNVLFHVENPRRDIAIYGNNALYKLQAVTVVPPLKKIQENGDNSRNNQHTPDQPAQKDFAKVLKEKADTARQDTSINYHTSGYTKDALAFYTIYQTREYTYNGAH